MCTGCIRTVKWWKRAARSWRKQMLGFLSQAVRKPSSMESAWLHSSMGQSIFRKLRLRASAPGSLRSEGSLRWSSKSSTGTLLIFARGAPHVLVTSEQPVKQAFPYKNLWKVPQTDWRQGTINKVNCTHISSNQEKYDMQPLYQLTLPKRSTLDGATPSQSIV